MGELPQNNYKFFIFSSMFCVFCALVLVSSANAQFDAANFPNAQLLNAYFGSPSLEPARLRRRQYRRLDNGYGMSETNRQLNHHFRRSSTSNEDANLAKFYAYRPAATIVTATRTDSPFWSPQNTNSLTAESPTHKISFSKVVIQGRSDDSENAVDERTARRLPEDEIELSYDTGNDKSLPIEADSTSQELNAAVQPTNLNARTSYLPRRFSTSADYTIEQNDRTSSTNNEDDNDVRSYKSLLQSPRGGNNWSNDVSPKTSSSSEDVSSSDAVENLASKFNDDDWLDGDSVKTYGFISKGFGYDRRNKKLHRGNKAYGYENVGHGYFRKPPSAHSVGGEKLYSYKSAGTGNVKRRGAQAKRTYLYSSKGSGTQQRTKLVGGHGQWGDAARIVTTAKNQYGYASKGFGTHVSNGRKEVKSYGYSNHGFGYEIKPVEHQSTFRDRRVGREFLPDSARVVRINAPDYYTRTNRYSERPSYQYANQRHRRRLLTSPTARTFNDLNTVYRLL